MDIRHNIEVVRFQTAAQRYCDLLESGIPEDPEFWVESITSALSDLYASAHYLPEVELPDDCLDVPDEFDVDDKEWKKLFDSVHEILGEQTYYWHFFDPSTLADDEEPVCGDLGDDLADIYRDIKPGLRAWDLRVDQYLPDIVFSWKCPLVSHWGVHATSALHALHLLAFLRGIQKE